MKKMILMLTVLAMSAAIYAEEPNLNVDENAMFSDTNSVVNSNQLTNNTMKNDKEGVSLSGRIVSRNTYQMHRSWLYSETSGDTNALNVALEGNFLVDMRWRQGLKAFINFAINYSALKQADYQKIVTNAATSQFADFLSDTPISVPEYFVDLNINRAVYFRLGKQVLQWGRCYFWNPTDLINQDRKNFFNMSAYRKGVVGLKVTVPFGTSLNFYGFIDGSDATVPSEFAVAGKVEFLLGRTEMSFSGWAKKDKLPVYGYDFSSRIGRVDIRGEVSLSKGENRLHLGNPQIVGFFTNYTLVQDTTNWIPRVSIGFTRTFDWNIPERISVTGEFYYNGSGYDENVFADQGKLFAMMMGGAYYPYNYGKYYGALFMTIKQVFTSVLSVNVNVLGNFSDNSYVLTTGLSYDPVFNVNLGMNVYGFFGPKDAELTYGDQGMALELMATMNF